MVKKEYLAFIISVIFSSLIVGYSVLAWQPAPPSPPDDNVDIPLNVSSNPQIKSAGLQLESLIVRGGANLATVSGDVTIGGDISATNNVRENCAWTAWDCAANMECTENRFLAGVGREVGGNPGCSSGVNLWYKMRLYCCDL
jgi:hypothetical protein